MTEVFESIARQSITRYLLGEGIELGPGHNPFPIAPHAVSVRYVDRWEPEENLALFPELAGATFPKPHIVSNLDSDRLSPLADESVDFVIASHVLEHLADPVGMLDEIHRVLRDGGTAVVLMPDRHRTFDSTRPPTPLDHLLEEFEAGSTEPSDDHVREFLRYVNGLDDPTPEEIALHKERSYHVHCWNEPEFREVIQHGIGHLGHRWHLLEGLATEDPEGSGIEFGYILKKLPPPVDADELNTRFDHDWHTMRQVKAAVQAREHEKLRPERDQLLAERDDARREVAELRQSTSWKVTAPLRTAMNYARSHRPSR